jgi:hypothetical protein
MEAQSPTPVPARHAPAGACPVGAEEFAARFVHALERVQIAFLCHFLGVAARLKSLQVIIGRI